jgi:hypothetical protein
MSIFSTAIAWIVGHVRLLIEYGLLIAFIVTCGIVLNLRVHSAKQDTVIQKVTDDLATAQQSEIIAAKANAEQDAAIATLKQLREKDSTAIAGLQNDFAITNSTTAAVKQKLSLLEKNNVQAKKLLDDTVPASLGCVLDHTPCAGTTPPGLNPSPAGTTAGSAAAAVSATDDGPD